VDNEKYCPTGPGGNTTLTNQDEQEILDRTIQGFTVETVGAQDAELH
jgi:hypothetical protein